MSRTMAGEVNARSPCVFVGHCFRRVVRWLVPVLFAELEFFFWPCSTADCLVPRRARSGERSPSLALLPSRTFSTACGGTSSATCCP